ncbi:hypothetical protein LSCM1_02043 [Leishmania martiniquensis]|uniref:Uncharacterized protein n=1 Tax=Leishmania martiniquensis TaxID=1580590 RepID=A0A836GVX8_9TRYP|nr:hypothetical protein LSCM1_02043 [Leishmania martiniquensis]
MSSIYRCTVCGRLTAMSLCPRCEAGTERYTPTLEEMHAAAVSCYGTSGAACTTSTAISLTVADINALARQNGAVSASAAISQHAAATSRSVAELQVMVVSLLEENVALRDEVQRNRRQMLRSARDVRELHAAYKLMRQKDLDGTGGLKGGSQGPRGVGEVENPDQELMGAALQQPQGVAAETVTCPSSEDSSVPPKVPTESQTSAEDVAALHAEVSRLQSALALKTQQLDDLWEYAECAEKQVQDLLQRLGHVQGILHEESQNSARLSRHLENVENSPEDIGSFISLRDRSSAPQRTPSNSTTQSPFASVGQRECLKRSAIAHGG